MIKALSHLLCHAAKTARRVMAVGLSAFVIAFAGPALAVDFAGWIESLHQEFWTIVNDQPNLQQSVWMALDGKQQDEILDQLNKDIWAGVLKIRAPAKAEETAKKLAEWRKKILDRDSEDWKFSVEESMTLSEIIDANTPQEGLTQKYGTKYASMLRTAVQDNPKLVAQAAGQIAGGDYQKAAEAIVPNLMASGLGTIVSDVLEELNYTDTKFAWGQLVANAGTLKTIGQALAKGNYDAAWTALTDQYQKNAKEYSKTAVAAAINSILAPSGLTSDPYSTGFRAVTGPAGNAMIDGSVNTIPVGELYVALVEAEMAFIDWGKKWLREQSSFGDGECIRRYEATYERLQSVSAAYEEFDLCIPTAKFSAMFAFRNGLKDLGMGYHEATKLFLEDHRKGAGFAPDPLTWLNRKVEMRKAALKNQLVPKLQDANDRVNRQHKLVFRHISEFLLTTALFKLDEARLEHLESELDRMVAELEATLERLEGDIERLARTYSAIPGACPAYETARGPAVEALRLGEAAQAKAHALQDEISAFDAAQCGDLSPSSATGDTFEAWLNETKIRRANLATLAANVLNDVTAICEAPQAIRNAPDKQSARDKLDETLDLARRGKEESVFDLNDETTALDRVVAEAEAADPAKWADGDSLQGQLDALRASMREVRTTYDTASQNLERAKTEMGRQVRRVRALMDSLDTKHETRVTPATEFSDEIVTHVATETLFDQIEAELKPLERAPVANNVRILMANLRALRDDAVFCDEQLKVSWIETGDLESRDSQGRMHPWSTRTLFINPPIAVLDGDVTELEQRCAALGESGGGPLEFLEAIREEQRLAGIEQASIEDALGRVDLCVSEALIAYDDRWLQPQLVAVPNVEGAKVSDATGVLSNAGLGLKIGDAAGHEDDATAAAIIAAQSPSAGEQADEGTDIVVALVPAPKPEEESGSTDAQPALAQGLDQLGRCDIDGFRQTYGDLPDDAPEKAALRAAYGEEQQAREVGKQGRALFEEGRYADALAALEQAAQLARCDDTRDRLQATAARARQEADAAAEAEQLERTGNEAVAAAQACDFSTAVAAARELAPGHPDRERVKVLLDAEKQARAQLEAGRAAAATGDQAGALAAYESARAASACPRTIAVIDQAIAGLPQPGGQSVAGGQGPEANQPATPTEPQVNVAAVGAEIESLVAACRLDEAEALLAQISGTSDWDYYWRMISDERYLIDTYNDAVLEAQAGGDPYFVQVLAEEVAFNARCHELASRGQSLLAAADDAIRQEEQWAAEQREAEQQQAMSDLATGLAGILDQLNGRGSSTVPTPSANPGIPAPSGGGAAGQDARCLGFQQEANAHGQRASRMMQEYQALGGSGADRATIQSKACALFRELQTGEDIVRRAQAAGCAPPNVPGGYAAAGMGAHC